jgi:predicted GNAT family acetyltransferase
MLTPVIVKKEDQTTARFIATVDGIDGEGELALLKMKEQLVIADHTGVPGSMAEKGVAKALVRALVEDARTQGYQIISRCSFVSAQFLQHPEWQDVGLNSTLETARSV